MGITVPANVMQVVGSGQHLPPGPGVTERLSLITLYGDAAVTFTMANYTVIYYTGQRDAFYHDGYHITHNLRAVVSGGAWPKRPLSIEDVFVKDWHEGENVPSMIGIISNGKEHYCTAARYIAGYERFAQRHAIAAYLADQFDQVNVATGSAYTWAAALTFPDEAINKIYGRLRFQMATNSQGSLMLNAYGGIRKHEVAVTHGIGCGRTMNIINPALKALFAAFGDVRVELRWKAGLIIGNTPTSSLVVTSPDLPGMTVLIPFINK